MSERYLSAQEVSERLAGRISVKTLANWRCDPNGKGPPFRKFGNRVLYAVSAFENWEQAQEFRSTAEYSQEIIAGVAPPLKEVDEIEALWSRMLAAPSDRRKAKITGSTLSKKRRR